MTIPNRRLTLDEAATYRIKVLGRLGKNWAGQFDDMTVTVESVGEGLAITTLSGTVADQAALHGILAHVRDLGLPLLLVQRTGGGTPDCHSIFPHNFAQQSKILEGEET
jgi:hypothetical protein